MVTLAWERPGTMQGHYFYYCRKSEIPLAKLNTGLKAQSWMIIVQGASVTQKGRGGKGKFRECDFFSTNRTIRSG